MTSFKILHIISCEEYITQLDTDLETFKIIFNMLLTTYLATPLDDSFSDVQKETAWELEIKHLFGEINNLFSFSSDFVDFLNSFVIEDADSSKLWLSLTINEFEITEVSDKDV